MSDGGGPAVEVVCRCTSVCVVASTPIPNAVRTGGAATDVIDQEPLAQLREGGEPAEEDDDLLTKQYTSDEGECTVSWPNSSSMSLGHHQFLSRKG